jgi:hypothetical protein
LIDNLLHRFGFSKLNYFDTKKVYPKGEIGNFHMNTRKPVVLLSPLDWGMGHTIRCIPIIHELLKRNCEVLVACNPKQKQLLSLEFTAIKFVHLDGYDISYGVTPLRYASEARHSDAENIDGNQTGTNVAKGISKKEPRRCNHFG